MNAVIITSIIGDYDNLKPVPTDLPCYVVADTPPWVNSTCDQWKFKRIYRTATSPERLSRMPKCLPQQFVEADASIWMDGSVRFKKDPAELLRYLDDGDIALSPHPCRTCIYDEAEEVIRLDRADPQVIQQQMQKYRREGYPVVAGLAACTVIVRRHTPFISRLGESWWAEQTRWSSRDQVSFNYVCWKLGIEWIPMAINPRENEFYDWGDHKVRREGRY